MKVCFIDNCVEDPRIKKPFLVQITGSEKYALRRYEDNQQIISALKECCRVETYNALSEAVDKIQQMDFYGLIITNCPPSGYRAELTAFEIAAIDKEERKQITEEDYEHSLNCIKKLHEKFGLTNIIAYTGAPKMIHSKLLEAGASSVIMRGSYDDDRLKKNIEQMIRSIG